MSNSSKDNQVLYVLFQNAHFAIQAQDFACQKFKLYNSQIEPSVV